ncbi:MAG: MGMT family protein [Candidatus Hermodarchaeota archaeon]|jgi:O-6-methylguanine DNA methyltransferase|nr:MGMT family protein [Candidatus Hermodarchaeota archaeon]
MTKIGITTLRVDPNRWLALALEENDNKLVACTSNQTEQEVVLNLKGALRRLKRLEEWNERVQSSHLSKVAQRLSLLIQGEERPFGFHEISMIGWSKSRIEISRQLLQVPKGKVISYGGLAKLANSSPRGVGSVMRTNPVPWAVPCHRVIHSDGRLGKLGGTVAGTKEKARILQAEGVPFNANGRVNEKAILL